MDYNKVLHILEEAIKEDETLFIVDLTIGNENKITAILDGDNGIPLKECIRVSRYLENNLDREDEDYSLEVSSPDITQPLKHVRQYNKNIGRNLKIKTKEEQFEGTLSNVNQEAIELTWKAREPKPIGKGKVTVEKKATIAYNDIIETKVKIKFN